MRFRLFAMSATLLLIVLALVGCAGGGKAGSDKELTIYSGRKEKYIKPVIEEFEKQTGIKVKLLAGDGSALANQIVEEKNNPRADLYASSDVGTLGFLREEDMLEKYQSEAIKKVRTDMKDPEGYWVAASVRARIIAYNTDLVKESEAPKTLMELTDPKWKGKLGSVNSTNESMIGQVSAMRLIAGDAYTEKWLKALKANDPLLNKSHDPIKNGVADGELHLGLMNHYYYAKMKAEGKPMAAVYPDQKGFGTFTNLSGLAIVKGTDDADLAQRFIDFSLSEEIQKIYAGINKEIPVLDSVAPEGDNKSLSEFKQAKVNPADLAKEIDKSVEMMEKIGL